ncbi:MAG: benzoate-CoA ligase family protein [Planctomycetota bacterium]|nr:benzoate-CoA ligase family protein [Planctomycetota bacterium]MDA0932347.1 benzoate-CoA ligase family protein [Planctomycetota bacterium]
MSFVAPAEFQIADHFLDARVAEGRGDRVALHLEDRTVTYAEVQAEANRYANLLVDAGVLPEQRVILALRDGLAYVAALFGVFKVGGVVVMLNPELNAEQVDYFLGYTRARAAFVEQGHESIYREGAAKSRFLDSVLVVDAPEFQARRDAASPTFDNFPTHRDDAAIWLFSGGTTGKPKAVVQTHRSFAYTTECYGKGTLGMSEDDVTLSVPKLFFGYATGINLLFPFSVGASAVLFPDRCTEARIFELIDRFRPTVLVNVPTMIKKLLDSPAAGSQDLSCLRLATSAGEALPPALHERWNEAYGIDLLDGLGTAEMWHIFISNLPGDVRIGSIGKVVPGFDVRVCDEDGRDVEDGQTGWLWVRGGARALGYWQQLEKTEWGFRGEWYVSGDLVTRDADGWFTYGGRADDMLKVSGRWLATREVEECLEEHPAVKEAAVVGVVDADGLTKPHAFVVPVTASPELGDELQSWVKERLEPYKYPRQVMLLDDLPRTHLGKVDRGQLRRL